MSSRYTICVTAGALKYEKNFRADDIQEASVLGVVKAEPLFPWGLVTEVRVFPEERGEFMDRTGGVPDPDYV